MARESLLCAILFCTATALLTDDSVLVQGGVRVHQQSAASTSSHLSRLELVQRAATEQLPQLPQFNCTQMPSFCQPPFNCQNWKPFRNAAETALLGMAPGGQPNFGMWCAAPDYYEYMEACITMKDLVKAAKRQFWWSIRQKTGVHEADGSYCFIEGHCTNTAVTNETTLEEANEMCDQRYGRKGWSELGKASDLPKLLRDASGIPQDLSKGFSDARATTLFLKAACAMGNYHCDVMYCKETYCKEPYYIKKYSHLLPKAPGHLLQSREWLD